VQRVKNINYVCSYGCSNIQKDSTVVLLGSNDSITECSNNIYSVDLDPLKYVDTPGMLLEPREKWFVNISNTSIPNDIIGLL